MSSMDEGDMELARVYSSALLDLAASDGAAEAVRNELLDFAAFLDKDTEFDTFLTSPTVDPGVRRDVFDKLFRGKYRDLLVNALQVLNRKDRLNLVRAVAETYRSALEEREGRIEVYVATAVPLSRRLRSRLEEVTSVRTGRKAELVERIDESLVGGLIVRIGDEKFDMTVTSRLRTLRNAFVDRASREIHAGRSFVEPSSS